jgi:hypothetical protein
LIKRNSFNAFAIEFITNKKLKFYTAQIPSFLFDAHATRVFIANPVRGDTLDIMSRDVAEVTFNASFAPFLVVLVLDEQVLNDLPVKVGA